MTRIGAIVDACQDDLEGYSRWLGKNPDKRGTPQALAFLPDEITQAVSSASIAAVKDRLLRATESTRYAQADARLFTTLWDCSDPERPTKRETTAICEILSKLGFGIEPDVRFGGPKLAPGSPVVVFRLPDGAPTSASGDYRAAASVMPLFLEIAQADGTIGGGERSRIEEHIRTSVALSPADRHRLTAHARWLTGRTYPISVSSTGGKYAYDDDQETPDTQSVHWEFDDLTMTFNLTLWTPYMKKTDFEFRDTDEYPNWTFNATKIEVFGTKGLMMFGRHADGWQVYGMDWNVAAQANGPQSLTEHTGNFLDCMKTRRRPNADIEEGHLSTFLCQMANISYRMGGRKLVLDVENESFKDDHDANELLKRSGRKPYRVPEDV